LTKCVFGEGGGVSLNFLLVKGPKTYMYGLS
jgi:hypothetical protein